MYIINEENWREGKTDNKAKKKKKKKKKKNSI